MRGIMILLCCIFLVCFAQSDDDPDQGFVGQQGSTVGVDQPRPRTNPGQQSNVNPAFSRNNAVQGGGGGGRNR